LTRLLAGLEARGQAANLVIVSDHGMAEISDARLIDLDAMMPAGAGRVVGARGVGRAAGGRRAGERRRHFPACGRSPERRVPAQARRRPALGFRRQCARAGRDLPRRCGLALSQRANPPYRTPSLGAHGYDPAAPEMAALFIANGPAFRAGIELETFDSVSVYPLLADLIGVQPAAHEGDLADTAPARVR